MYETNLTEQRKRVNRYSHLEKVIAELESTLSRERWGLICVQFRTGTGSRRFGCTYGMSP